MQVVAMQDGFYKAQRKRLGDIFDMDDAAIKRDKDGKIIRPKWVKAAPNAHEAKREAAAVKQAAQEKQRAGAIAASGGKAAKDKVDTARDLAG